MGISGNRGRDTWPCPNVSRVSRLLVGAYQVGHMGHVDIFEVSRPRLPGNPHQMGIFARWDTWDTWDTEKNQSREFWASCNMSRMAEVPSVD